MFLVELAPQGPRVHWECARSLAEESSSHASRLCLNICDHCPLEVLHQLVHDLEQNFLHQEVVYLILFSTIKLYFKLICNYTWN